MPTSTKQVTIVNTVIAFCYSLICYFLSVMSLIYFIVFVSGVYDPISINHSQIQQPFAVALVFNLFLIALFGLQHSIMARNKFKQWLFQYLPESVERATYCLGTAIVLTAMVYFWMPMNGDVWSVTGETTIHILQAISAAGWVLLFIATFQLDHFELFGLKQTFFPLIGKKMPTSKFRTPGLYKIVRHPIQLGVLIGIWSVPKSTVNHLVLAIGMTTYILVGLYFEEKSLIEEFGQSYKDYKKRVAKLLPFAG